MLSDLQIVYLKNTNFKNHKRNNINKKENGADIGCAQKSNGAIGAS
jgi:hypothetical protein